MPFSEAMAATGLNVNDQKTREAMGRALRATYELDGALPEQLAALMLQVQQRLDHAPDGSTDGQRAVKA